MNEYEEKMEKLERRMRFLRAVAAKLPDDATTVGEALSEDALKALYAA